MIRRAVQAFARDERAPNDHLYLLLDPLAPCAPQDPLSIQSLTHALGEHAIARVMRPYLSHTPDACPALVQLAAPGDIANTSVLAAAERSARDDASYKKRYVCGWLTSDQPLAALADHLAARCLDVITPIAGKRMTPWFEPLRLELLAASMERAFPALLWPVKRWLCPTSCGTYTLFRGAHRSWFGKPASSAGSTACAACRRLPGCLARRAWISRDVCPHALAWPYDSSAPGSRAWFLDDLRRIELALAPERGRHRPVHASRVYSFQSATESRNTGRH